MSKKSKRRKARHERLRQAILPQARPAPGHGAAPAETPQPCPAPLGYWDGMPYPTTDKHRTGKVPPRNVLDNPS